jgi:hypothetical protein
MRPDPKQGASLYMTIKTKPFTIPYLLGVTTSNRPVHFEVISQSKLEVCNIGSLQDDVAEI